GQVQSGVSAQEDIIIYCQCLDVGYATGEVQTAQVHIIIGVIDPQCVFAFAHVNREVAVYSVFAYPDVVIANSSLDAFEICATGHIKIEVTGVLCAVQGFEFAEIGVAFEIKYARAADVQVFDEVRIVIQIQVHAVGYFEIQRVDVAAAIQFNGQVRAITITANFVGGDVLHINIGDVAIVDDAGIACDVSQGDGWGAAFGVDIDVTEEEIAARVDVLQDFVAAGAGQVQAACCTVCSHSQVVLLDIGNLRVLSVEQTAEAA